MNAPRIKRQCNVQARQQQVELKMRKSTDPSVRNATAEEERATTDALHRSARPGGMSSTLEKFESEVFATVCDRLKSKRHVSNSGNY